MKEEGRNNLLKAIGELPEFSAPDNNWIDIKRKLSLSTSKQKQTISSLPEFKAPESIWLHIEGELSKSKIKKVKLRLSLGLKIAATIALLIVAGISALYFNSLNARPEVTITHEYEDSELFNEMNFLQQESQFEILKSNCEIVPQICESQVYKEISSQLKEVMQEQQKLEVIIKDQPKPRLLKYYYNLDNERIELEKLLVKMFIES